MYLKNSGLICRRKVLLSQQRGKECVTKQCSSNYRIGRAIL